MKRIYFLHGYQTSGKKFHCLQKFYENSDEYLPICWNWNENMNISKFFEEKIEILKEYTGEKIIMADSMGANLAWNLVNIFPSLQYVMTNPVFSPEQIIDQDKIPLFLRPKIFSATTDTITNKNIHLIISEFDEVLDPEYYKNVFGDSLKVLKLKDEHRIIHMDKYMPLIHQIIVDAFEKTKMIN